MYIYQCYQTFVSPCDPLLTETLHVNKSEQVKTKPQNQFWEPLVEKNPNVLLPPLSHLLVTLCTSANSREHHLKIVELNIYIDSYF